jgi:hypothetical protein
MSLKDFFRRLRKKNKVKFGKPLEEIGERMLEGKSLEESVVDYAKEVAVNNFDREKVSKALDDLIYHVGLLQLKIPEIVAKIDSLVVVIQGSPLDTRAKERIVYRLNDVRNELTGKRVSVALTVLNNLKYDWERGKV